MFAGRLRGRGYRGGFAGLVGPVSARFRTAFRRGFPARCRARRRLQRLRKSGASTRRRGSGGGKRRTCRPRNQSLRTRRSSHPAPTMLGCLIVHRRHLPPWRFPSGTMRNQGISRPDAVITCIRVRSEPWSRRAHQSTPAGPNLHHPSGRHRRIRSNQTTTPAGNAKTPGSLPQVQAHPRLPPRNERAEMSSRQTSPNKIRESTVG